MIQKEWHSGYPSEDGEQPKKEIMLSSQRFKKLFKREWYRAHLQSEDQLTKDKEGNDIRLSKRERRWTTEEEIPGYRL